MKIKDLLLLQANSVIKYTVQKLEEISNPHILANLKYPHFWLLPCLNNGISQQEYYRGIALKYITVTTEEYVTQRLCNNENLHYFLMKVIQKVFTKQKLNVNDLMKKSINWEYRIEVTHNDYDLRLLLRIPADDCLIINKNITITTNNANFNFSTQHRDLLENELMLMISGMPIFPHSSNYNFTHTIDNLFSTMELVPSEAAIPHGDYCYHQHSKSKCPFFSYTNYGMVKCNFTKREAQNEFQDNYEELSKGHEETAGVFFCDESKDCGINQ
jgi:hypothetical protein